MSTYELDALLEHNGDVFSKTIEAESTEDAINKLVSDISFCKFAEDTELQDVSFCCNGDWINTRFNKPETSNQRRYKTKKKYSIGYAIATQPRLDKTYTVCIRLHVNGKTSYCPTPYHITKTQWGNKDFSHTRAELREEILAFLNKEIEDVKQRLNVIPQEELYAMDAPTLYQNAFHRNPSKKGRAKKEREDSDLKNIPYTLQIKESTKQYINKVAKKCGYTTATQFLNEAIFATMTGVAKADDLDPASIKAEYMRYMRNPERYIKILKGEIEEPIKPNRKRYKYGLGF